MTSFLSVLNSLDPVPDRLLVGAVMRMSSSSRTRRAAAAWLVGYGWPEGSAWAWIKLKRALPTRTKAPCATTDSHRNSRMRTTCHQSATLSRRLMLVEIVGTHLPGRRCGPNPAGERYQNIHVGIGVNREPLDLVAGDAEAARWRVEVRTPRLETGELDFRGRFVHGHRGDRFLYLNWGDVTSAGEFKLFRRAKIILSEIPAGLVEQAQATATPLACTVSLTDRKGWPVCARLRPPALVWRLASGTTP